MKNQLVVLGLVAVLSWAGLASAQLPVPATAWYDATVPGTVLDTLGAPAVEGAQVGMWLDQSGNGIDLYCRNPGLDGEVIAYSNVARTVNGAPSVAWSWGAAAPISPSAGGAQNHTYLTSYDPLSMPDGAYPQLASNELTIFAVGNYRTLTHGALCSVYDTTHGAPEWGQFDPDSSMEDGAMIGYCGYSGWHSNYMSNYAGVSGGGPPTAIMEGVFGRSPVATNIFIDGVMGSYPPGTSSNDAWGTQHVLGDLDESPFSPRGVKLGHGDFWHPGWNYPDMDVAEVIIYNRRLTDAERWSVGAYLSQKYQTAPYTQMPFVPEPATMALLALGGLGLLRRRRA